MGETLQILQQKAAAHALDFEEAKRCRDKTSAMRSGASAEAAEASEVDVAILDVHLAGGETNGSIAAELIQRGIPFLVSTGGFIHSQEAVYAGHPLLFKPFTCDSLAKALGNLTSVIMQSRETSLQIRGGLEL